MRGKVNVGELEELVSHVRATFGWTVEKTALELHFTKGYVSKLLSIAENPTVLEKLKNGLLSYKEAYNEALSFSGKQESQETRRKEKLTETIPLKKEEPLTDEDLGITTSLKQAMEEGKRFKPLSPEEEAESKKQSI